MTLIADHSSHGRFQKRKWKKDLLNRKPRDHHVRNKDHNGSSNSSHSIVNSANSANSSNQLLFAHKISGKIEEVNSMDKVLRNLSSLSKKDHNRKEKDLLSNNTNQIQLTPQVAIHTLQLKSNSLNSVSQKAESHKLLKRDNKAQRILELCST